MPVLETSNFGAIAYEPESVIEFPRGLPGFEGRRRFLAVQTPNSVPLVFLQSLEEPSLCFPTMPVLVLDSQYRLQVAEEDLDTVGLPRDRQPRIGEDVLCVAVLSFRETGATANLLAPVVVNLKNQKAVQAIAPESDYSHQHALFPRQAAACS